MRDQYTKSILFIYISNKQPENKIKNYKKIRHLGKLNKRSIRFVS